MQSIRYRRTSRSSSQRKPSVAYHFQSDISDLTGTTSTSDNIGCTIELRIRIVPRQTDPKKGKSPFQLAATQCAKATSLHRFACIPRPCPAAPILSSQEALSRRLSLNLSE